ICEYLAKCPIYDYKEALEAGALGEDIDFRSFDISKMVKKKIDINFCPNCGVKITEKINFCGDCGQKLN
ncbi:MAG: zinc-ribbon domain-containing protein, partial [Flavobacteriaceae bacterium]|nr:zinc-ribbon domain-containing protein [Flavobacteriaceae bacterium]